MWNYGGGDYEICDLWGVHFRITNICYDIYSRNQIKVIHKDFHISKSINYWWSWKNSLKWRQKNSKNFRYQKIEKKEGNYGSHKSVIQGTYIKNIPEPGQSQRPQESGGQRMSADIHTTLFCCIFGIGWTRNMTE